MNSEIVFEGLLERPRQARRGGVGAKATTGPVAAASRPVRIAGYVLATWFTAFAAVNAWHLATGVPGREDYPDYAAVIVAMSVVVLLLKLAGAAIAIGAILQRPQGSWLLAALVWGAASVLVLYSAGNLVFAAGMVSGLMQPSEAGDITPRLVAYVLFFAAGAVLASTLAVSAQRRHQPTWTAPAAGLIGAPVLLAVVMVFAPALLMAVT